MKAEPQTQTANNCISVIVPMHNAQAFILQTIACVVNQTYRDFELLLVDDASTDGTVALVQQYLQENPDPRIRLLCLPANCGAANTRNAGLAAATGRYIAYLDADDLWVLQKLQKTLAFLKEKAAAFVFTGYEFADEAGEGTGKIVRVPAQITYRQALKNTTIFTSTVLFDTEKISKETLQMPDVKSEDTALWWKVLRGGVTAYGLDENLVRYRRAGASLSSNKAAAVARIWHLYRKVEGFGVLYSLYLSVHWALRAVLRRI